jgi:cytochrome c peroxidase
VPPRGALTLSAAGGSGGGYTWSLATNASGGSISAAGDYTAGATPDVSDVVQVTDSVGNVATRTVGVTAGVTITPSSSSVLSLAPVSFTASGGSGTGYVWSLSSSASGGSITASGAYVAGTTVNVSDAIHVVDSLGNVAGATVVVLPTPVATPPAALPALTGFSTGYRVVQSAGMALPSLSGVPGAADASPVPRPVVAPGAAGPTIVDDDAAIRLGKALFWDAQAGSDGQIACASCHFRAGADNRRTNTVHPGADLVFQVSGPGGTVPLFTTFAGDDVIGSSGVLSRSFVGISANPADPVDVCDPHVPADAAQALLAQAGERLVTGRNTPPAVSAVFNRDNFWDGRAKHGFNGFNPIGLNGGTPFIENASLASQAVGPPLSDVEMSCAGRTFNGVESLGAKLVPRIPLQFQLVHPQDSALGALSNAPGNGLQCGFGDRLCTYADLMAAAFGTGGRAGQAAIDFYVENFSSIWGQAIQAYEATLVPDRTPYDLGLLTPNQVAGLTNLRNNRCLDCHVEPEFTDATIRFFDDGPPNANGSDKGFHNIGASPTAADLGRAASPGPIDSASPNNRGAFKTPTLRNVKLTAPYMHNGSLATLADVAEFYDTDPGTPPGPGVQHQNPELDARAVGAGFGGGGTREAQAIDFLLNGLTDCRVEHELAPFDHPALALPNGPSLPARGRSGDGAVCP